jgi:3',5'-cyclic-AMP phosphodiesterase
VVPAGRLKSVLGITDVKYVARHSHLAIIDSTLEEKV